MQQIIDKVAQAAGIGSDTATLVVGLIFGFIKKEGPQGAVEKLFAAFPEAEAIVAKAAAAGGGLGALVGGLGSMLGGKAGDAMALVTQLLGTGATMSQLETAGEVLFSTMRAEAGPKVVGDILKHVPALSKFAPSA